jgi:hypothetical protein
MRKIDITFPMSIGLIPYDVMVLYPPFTKKDATRIAKRFAPRGTLRHVAGDAKSKENYLIRELQDINDASNLGTAQYWCNLILINGNLNENRFKQVLSHEVAHAIRYESGYFSDDQHDEPLTQALAFTLEYLVSTWWNMQMHKNKH